MRGGILRSDVHLHSTRCGVLDDVYAVSYPMIDDVLEYFASGCLIFQISMLLDSSSKVVAHSTIESKPRWTGETAK
jgi:hypothetical protein